MFSNKKYPITIQTRPNLVNSNFLIEKPVLKVIGVQNQLPIIFSSDLVCNNTLKAKNLTSTHEFLTFNILIAH